MLSYLQLLHILPQTPIRPTDHTQKSTVIDSSVLYPTVTMVRLPSRLPNNALQITSLSLFPLPIPSPGLSAPTAYPIHHSPFTKIFQFQASTNYKEAFALFDKRGNGRVALQSLGDLLRACGQNPTLAEIRELEAGVGGDCMFLSPLLPPSVAPTKKFLLDISFPHMRMGCELGVWELIFGNWGLETGDEGFTFRGSLSDRDVMAKMMIG